MSTYIIYTYTYFIKSLSLHFLLCHTPKKSLQIEHTSEKSSIHFPCHKAINQRLPNDGIEIVGFKVTGKLESLVGGEVNVPDGEGDPPVIEM